MPTLTVRVIPAKDLPIKPDDVAVQLTLGHQQQIQEYCMVFETPSEELNTFATYLEQEYGEGSKSYQKDKYQTRFHQSEASGSGQDTMRHPVKVFQRDAKGQFGVSGGNAGGVFFDSVIKDAILDDTNNTLKDLLAQRGVTLIVKDETLRASAQHRV